MITSKMKRKIKKEKQNVTPVNSDKINSQIIQDDITAEINLGDIFNQINYNTTLSYNLTLEILSLLNIGFLDDEWKSIKTNHCHLMEFIHYIIVKTITKIQKPKYEKIDDVVEFNFNMVAMFLEPFNVNEEEIEWVDTILLNKNKKRREVEIKIPEDAKRNYLIHLKRVLDENISNTDINQSVIEYLRGNDLNQ